MRVSSEALAKEDWSFGGLRRTEGATGSCPWGSTSRIKLLHLPGAQGPADLGSIVSPMLPANADSRKQREKETLMKVLEV
jgi:hypothetical protein